MAVYAAHLTRTLHGKPSIFQVTAQEALGATVKPALRKVVEYLAALYPNKFAWTVAWYDELFLLFDTCLQYHYLQHYAASFSESFYGLLRVPIDSNSEFSSGQRLSQSLELLSLASLVLLPYLQEKAEAAVLRWTEEQEDGTLGKGVSGTVKSHLIRVYSVAHTVCSLARLAQLCAYVAGGARAHGPALAALRLTLKDAPPPAPPEHSWGDVAKSLLKGDMQAMVTFPLVGGLVLRAVEYGMFVVQFLRWWEANPPTVDRLPLPPPPTRDEQAIRLKNKCPLCLQSWKTPTVLPVSGYVFCYSCISRSVRARGACPVSRLPAAEDSLVRLYVDC